ncbi:MAG: hypothetical protein Q8878_07695 [Bacillota bacterium]|nr:hypothetical protein [Bacillota bacterium]
MNRRLKLLSVFFCILILTSTVYGCKPKNNEPAANEPSSSGAEQSKEKKEIASYSKYISVSGKKLASEKGKGEENTVDVGGKNVVIAMTYKESLFGFDADVVYTISDGISVSDIIFNFDKATADEISQKMTSAFGEPSKVTQESESTNYEEQWESSGFRFSLLDNKTTVSLTITKGE